MKPHSVFLRKECVLPERLDPLREPAGEGWTRLEEITAPIFDTMIRRMGWHFLLMHRPYARKGFGFTQKDAAERALTSGLKGVASRFNAVELVSAQAKKYPGFYIACITLQPRQIQQYTSLENAEDWHRLAVPSR